MQRTNIFRSTNNITCKNCLDSLVHISTANCLIVVHIECKCQNKFEIRILFQKMTVNFLFMHVTSSHQLAPYLALFGSIFVVRIYSRCFDFVPFVFMLISFCCSKRPTL